MFVWFFNLKYSACVLRPRSRATTICCWACEVGLISALFLRGSRDHIYMRAQYKGECQKLCFEGSFCLCHFLGPYSWKSDSCCPPPFHYCTDWRKKGQTGVNMPKYGVSAQTTRLDSILVLNLETSVFWYLEPSGNQQLASQTNEHEPAAKVLRVGHRAALAARLLSPSTS